LRKELCPNLRQRAGEGGGLLPHPTSHRGGTEPSAALEFFRIELEGTFGLKTVDPDMLMAGPLASGHFEQSSGRFGQDQTEFLAHLAHSTSIVAFAGIQVARSRGIPRAGKCILLHRALLEKDVASLIKNEDMHGAVLEAEPMDFAAAFLADYFVLVIDYIKDFFAHDYRRTPVRRYGFSGISRVSRTNCSRLTCSARTCGESPVCAKAFSRTFTGH